MNALNEAQAVAIQPADGKIVLAGSRSGATRDVVVVRLDNRGQLDHTFNPCQAPVGAADACDGKVATDFAVTSTEFAADEARGVAIQADGKMIAVGSSNAGGTGLRFALARYNTDGTLDTGFGTGGKVLTDFGPAGQTDIADAVAVQADGKILVAGRAADRVGSDGSDFGLARYNAADGSLDQSFGVGGVVTTAFGCGPGAQAHDQAHALAIQPDGKVVVAGRSHQSDGCALGAAGPHFALARYHGSDGSLDDGFGVGGRVRHSLGAAGTADGAYGVQVQADGKIVAAGVVTPAGRPSDLAVVRLLSDGLPDLGFGTGGSVLADFTEPGAGDDASAVLIDGDGGIVVAGAVFSGSGATAVVDFALARYVAADAVTDRDPPTLVLPANITAAATGPAGASVTYLVTATDDTDADPDVVCSPDSGSTFAIGDTTVTCRATDATQKESIGTFTVTVLGGPEQVTRLGVALHDLALPSTVERSLLTKVHAAQRALAEGRVPPACSVLGDFAEQVADFASAGKLTGAQAAALLADATRIRAVLACAT